MDLYKAELVNGKYEKVENLGPQINTFFIDECPYIAPDESFIIFNCWKYNSKFKGNNLYVSFKDKDGKWGAPKDLGDRVNTDDLDIYPYVTPDGKYLMFTRRENSLKANYSKLYWIKASVIDSAKESKEISSAPVTIPSDESKNYSGIYSSKEVPIKITVRQESNYLSASFENGPGIFVIESIGKDSFWGNGIKFQFNRTNGELKVTFDWKGGNGFVLTRGK